MTRTNNARLSESVHSVASIAEETAAGVQEVNASIMEQDDAISDIAEQAIKINEISQVLFQEINVFKINAEEADAEEIDAEETKDVNEVVILL